MTTFRTPARRPRRITFLRIATAATMALAIIASFGLPAEAVYLPDGMPTRTFNYKTHGINDTWVAIYDTGNIRWNQHAGADLGRSDSAAADATAGEYSESWYGRYEPHGSRSDRTFTIRLNARTLLAKFGSGRIVAAGQVGATHELGHALSLAHIGPGSITDSIMDYADIDDLRIQLPTAYDRSEVERIY